MVKNRMGKKHQITPKGFTLIELIIVIAIIAILASAIFVAVDPARRLHESRNARRTSDVTNILDAVVKYQTDNEGTHYTTVATMTVNKIYQIGTCTSGGTTGCTSKTPEGVCVNLSGIGSNYLNTIPKDPLNTSDSVTAYYIKKDALNSITVGACNPESEGAGGAGDAPVIELSR